MNKDAHQTSDPADRSGKVKRKIWA